MASILKTLAWRMDRSACGRVSQGTNYTPDELAVLRRRWQAMARYAARVQTRVNFSETSGVQRPSTTMERDRRTPETGVGRETATVTR